MGLTGGTGAMKQIDAPLATAGQASHTERRDGEMKRQAGRMARELNGLGRITCGWT